MQQITPIEIRQKSFGKSFRGYNTDEVDAFLYSLAHAWEKLTVQFNEVSDTLEQSSKEIRRLQGVENAIVKTLNESESTARSIIDKATKEADLKARETEFEIESMLRKAHEKAKAVEAEYAKKYQVTQEQMEQKLEATKKVVQEIEVHRDTLLQKLQHMAKDILAKGQMIEDDIHTRRPIDEERKEGISTKEPAQNLSLADKALKAMSGEHRSTQATQDSISTTDEGQRSLLTRIQPISAP